MDIPATLGAVKSAIDAAKILRETGRAWDEATFKLRIIELISALSDAQTAIADLNAELRARDEKIAALQRELTEVASLVYRAPFYWRPASDGQPEDGPFCQSCFDSAHRLSRPQKTVHTRIWRCEVCKSDFRWSGDPA
jgi:hypothetical protein